MTEQDVKLLLLDLCARLPYGVKIQSVKEPDTAFRLCAVDIESKEISSRILNISTPEQIASVIAEVFNKYFDLHSQPSEYIKPATRIKELLQPKKVGGSSNGEDTVS